MGAWCAYEVNRLKQELTTQTERVKELEAALLDLDCEESPGWVRSAVKQALKREAV